ncbi:hypothetical protein GT347_01740 [Xylophilus rhododendri]|uniref:Tc toxin complex TcA C-terminal TcB-binding domain-containing protein n=1 Tax=Xylophilus rhododendri TaxID=2697032 RepID=A0A857IZ12_9BURK|nr:neuraminidase-like domain-containing protein [Xylophilus rhododendri]QHI96824.1 hypothetical protein GT347_01740 [Xylophilus rhododendri]
MNNPNILAELATERRNALVAYYLEKVVTTIPAIKGVVTTENDLYQYLWLDNQVGHQVRTTRVAEAISSLQQYINGIRRHIEPGYGSAVQDGEEWERDRASYARWSANQQLRDFPEIYIEPPFRLGKTFVFQELETTLNQGKINQDSAQAAVLAYLNSFEEIANLEWVSGYQAGLSQDRDLCFFVGRTRAKPYQYYWRSFDLRNRNKANVPYPTAWSEWKKIKLPLSEFTLEDTVRPVFMNNRLYMAWVDVRKKPVKAEEPHGPQLHTTQIYIAPKKFDDNWGSPHLLREIEAKTAAENISIDRLIATVDAAVAGTENNARLVLLAFNQASRENSRYVLSVCNLFLTPQSVASQETYVKTLIKAFEDKSAVQHPYAGSRYFVKELRSLGAPSANWSGPALSSIKLTASYDELANKVRFGAIGSYAPQNPIDIGVIALTQAGVVGFDLVFELRSTVSEKNISVIGTVRVEKYDKQALLVSSETRMALKISAGDRDVDWHTTAPLTSPIDETVEFLQGRSSLDVRFDMPFTEMLDIKIAVRLNKVRIRGRDGMPDVTLIGGKKLSLPHHDFGIWTAPNGAPLAVAKMAPNGAQKASYEFAPNLQNQLAYEFIVGFSRESGLGALRFQLVFDSSNRLLPFLIKYLASTDAQYLDVDTLKSVHGFSYRSIRLNTLFGKELIARAHVSIDYLLNWETQRLPEPLIPEPPVAAASGVMDFYGANGLYFWELFFHLAFMVAWRMNQELRFEEAASWLHYIFNPYDSAADMRRDNRSERYWFVRPLAQALSEGGAKETSPYQNPADPDAIAMAKPIHYRKAVFLAYIKNMRDRGNAAYRELTRDGLSSAKLWYVAALDLLGPRPDVNFTSNWPSPDLKGASDTLLKELGALEARFGEGLKVLPMGNDALLGSAPDGLFRKALNTQLQEYWDGLDGDLYNLRHGFTIDGKPLSLSPFATPMDPREVLLEQGRGGNAGPGASVALAMAAIPPYRFQVMLSKAHQAVDVLTQYGSQLQNILERKDLAHREELTIRQQQEIFQFTLDLEQQHITMAEISLEGMKISRRAIEDRRHHYHRLYDEYISSSEMEALDLRLEAGIWNVTSSISYIAAGILSALPNTFGLANGGGDFGAPVRALGGALQIAGDINNMNALRVETIETYRRRRQEWGLQIRQADWDLDQLAKQIEQQEKQVLANRTQLSSLHRQKQQMQETLDFLSTRFSGASLYQWLLSRISALYYQAHDAVVSVCLATEAAWQVEMGDFTSRFIQGGAWEDRYKGLLAGEHLKFSLLRMDHAYVMGRERRLEIVKTISVKNLLGTAPIAGDARKQSPWDKALAQLRSTGKVDFSFAELLYDRDYPGHYLRQIAAVTVSLPAVVAPYQDVRAVLTQTDSHLLTKADQAGVAYLLNPLKAGADPGDHVKRQIRASQQIALSTGMDDSGMFVLNFNDERYLPFEGTGAVSSWQLEFPNPQSQDQQRILESLTDVIVRVHYTAKQGGADFSNKVQALVKAL